MVSEGEYFEDLEDLENIEDEGGQTELYEHRRVVADSGQNSVRVDKFLMDHLRDTSRNRIQKAAEAGYIMANGKPVKSIILRIIQQKVIQIVITTIKGFDFIILSQPHNPDQILFHSIRN